MKRTIKQFELKIWNVMDFTHDVLHMKKVNFQVILPKRVKLGSGEDSSHRGQNI